MVAALHALLMTQTVSSPPPCSVLGAAAALVPAAAAKAADDAQGVASSRMSYSRFLEYLDMGRVKKVGVGVVWCGVVVDVRGHDCSTINPTQKWR